VEEEVDGKDRIAGVELLHCAESLAAPCQNLCALARGVKLRIWLFKPSAKDTFGECRARRLWCGRVDVQRLCCSGGDCLSFDKLCHVAPVLGCDTLCDLCGGGHDGERLWWEHGVWCFLLCCAAVVN